MVDLDHVAVLPVVQSRLPHLVSAWGSVSEAAHDHA